MSAGIDMCFDVGMSRRPENLIHGPLEHAGTLAVFSDQRANPDAALGWSGEQPNTASRMSRSFRGLSFQTCVGVLLRR